MIEILNSAAAAWWSWIAPISWQVALLAGIVLLIDLSLPRRAWPQLRYALWLLVFVRLLIPPGFALPTSVSARLMASANPVLRARPFEVRPRVEPTTQLPPQTPGRPAVPLPPTQSSVALAPALTPHAWMMVVASAVSVLLLAWFLKRALYLRRHILGGPCAVDPPAWIRNALAECAARLRLRRVPRLVVTTGLASPAVFGLVRPTVLLPARWCEEVLRKKLDHMLLHELAHVKRRDTLATTLQTILHLLFWFHPAVWLAGRRLRLLRELCCDAAVASVLRDRTPEYRATIMQVARQILTPRTDLRLGLLGLFENPSRLRQRLQHLNRPTWRHPRLRICTTIAALALMLAFVIPMAGGAALSGVIRLPAEVQAEHFNVGYRRGPNESHGKADSNGRFVLADLIPGRGTMSVSIPSQAYMFISWPVTVKPSEVTELDVDLAKFTTVQGRVTRGGEPLAGVTVAAFNLDRTVLTHHTTDDRGMYKLFMYEGGIWDVIYTWPDGRKALAVDVKEGSQKLDFEVTTGAISGTITVPKPPAALSVWKTSVPGFAVISTYDGPETAEALAAVLADNDQTVSPATASTLREAMQTNEAVIVLLTKHCRPEMLTSDIFDALKSRKVIGIGYGAAQLFEEIGLEISARFCAHSYADPKVVVVQNPLIDHALYGKPFVAFHMSSPEVDQNAYFHMHIPTTSPLRSVVDVIARSEEATENYAPVVKQGNYILFGLAAPPRIWSPAYRRFFHDVAVALKRSDLQPFSVAKWPITRPGTYTFALGQGFGTEQPFGKHFYFKVSRPIHFSARLEHSGSNSMMLLLAAENPDDRKTIRQDARRGEPLVIDKEITDKDIKSVGDRYWRLDVANCDREHAADCTLTIDYRH